MENKEYKKTKKPVYKFIIIDIIIINTITHFLFIYFLHNSLFFTNLIS